MRFLIGFTCSLCILLSGCSTQLVSTGTPPPQVTDVPIPGKLLNGTLPVVGAHVYLFAAGTTGYGAASVSLLDPQSTGYQDAIGTYVITGADGSFTIPGYYSCASGAQIYVYASGGTSGLGENSAATQMAALGLCPALGTTVAPIIIDEATTVAASFALAGFATDPLHISSSGTQLAQTGVANAFLTAQNLVLLATGMAPTMLPSGSATVPQQTINTLANIAASCIHSSGSESQSCASLFANVQTTGTPPVDTATALIDIAHSPAANVPTLYAIQGFAPFTPALTLAPNDFSLALVFTGGGIVSPTSMAVDSAGNDWVVSEDGSAVTEISSAGAFSSGPNGYPAGLFAAGPVAIDTSGNVYIGNYAADLAGGGSIVELSSSGVVLNGVDGYEAGAIRAPNGLALDAADNIWVANLFPSTVTELSNAGQALSGPVGLSGGGLTYPQALAVDASGNVWTTDEAFGITEFSNAGVALSPSTGFTGTGFYGGSDLAIDNHGNVWVSDTGGYAQVAKFSPAGVLLSGPGFTAGGIGSTGGAYHIAMDGAGDAWVPLSGSDAIAELSNAGDALSGPNGYGGGIAQFPLAVAVDGSGDVWLSSAVRQHGVPDAFRVTELIGIAVPVVTPIALGVKNNTIASRP